MQHRTTGTLSKFPIVSRGLLVAFAFLATLQSPQLFAESALEKFQKKLEKVAPKNDRSGATDSVSKVQTSFVNLLPAGESLPPLFTSLPSTNLLKKPVGTRLRSVTELPDGTTIIATDDQIYATTQRGTQWKTVAATLNNKMTGFAVVQGGKMFMSTFNSVLRSDDFGQTWKSVGGIGRDGWWGMVSGSSGFVIVYGPQGIYQSDDLGVTWRELGAQFQVKGVGYAFVDTNDDLYIGRFDGLFVRRNGQGNWQLISAGDHQAALSGNNGRICSYAAYGLKEESKNILVAESGTKLTRWTNPAGANTRLCAVDKDGFVYTLNKFDNAKKAYLHFSPDKRRIISLSLAGTAAAVSITPSNMIYLIDAEGRLSAIDLDAANKRSEEIRSLLLGAGFNVTKSFSATDSWLKNFFDVQQIDVDLATKYFVSLDGGWYQKDRDQAHVPFGAGNSAPDQQAVARSVVAAFPKEKMIEVPGKGGPVAVILSAWDCPPCNALETWLRKEGFAYFVVPLSISEANAGVSKSLWCSKDRLALWQNPTSLKAKAATAVCDEWDEINKNFMVQNPIYKGGKLPQIYLFDGTVVEGYVSSRQQELKQLLLKGRISQ